MCHNGHLPVVRVSQMIDQNSKIIIFIIIPIEYSQTQMSSGGARANSWLFLTRILDYHCCNLVPCMLLIHYMEYQHPWHENQWKKVFQANSHSSVTSKFFAWNLVSFSWMTLASNKSYINMKESCLRSDRYTAILPDACWCLLNDLLMISVVAQSLCHKSSNHAVNYH